MTIRPADPTELDTLARLLADAFDEPVTRWLVPDPTRHPQAIGHLFALAAADALAHGSIDVLTDDADRPLAAALWFDHTTPDPDDGDSDGDQVPGSGWHDAFTGDAGDAARWELLDDLMTRHHLTGSHHYLFAIGVHPAVQGRGLGSRLLTHRHQRLDGVPTYLEATSPASRRLYQRHGYTDLGQIRPVGGPPLWPMLRPTPVSTSTRDTP